jgi:hypothetical protein
VLVGDIFDVSGITTAQLIDLETTYGYGDYP